MGALQQAQSAEGTPAAQSQEQGPRTRLGRRAVVVLGNGDWGRLGLGLPGVTVLPHCAHRAGGGMSLCKSPAEAPTRSCSWVSGVPVHPKASPVCSLPCECAAAGAVYAVGKCCIGQCFTSECCRASPLHVYSLPWVCSGRCGVRHGAEREGPAGVGPGALPEGYSPLSAARHPHLPSQPWGLPQFPLGPTTDACVDRKGDVWVWGSNGSGQLGLGAGAGSQFAPQLLEVLKGARVKDLALGSDHSLACTGKPQNPKPDARCLPVSLVNEPGLGLLGGLFTSGHRLRLLLRAPSIPHIGAVPLAVSPHTPPLVGACVSPGLFFCRGGPPARAGEGRAGPRPGRPCSRACPAAPGEPTPRLQRSLQEDRVTVESVSAGMLHSACIRQPRPAVHVRGNRFAQLGLGDEKDRDSPARLSLPGRTESVSCGIPHSGSDLEG